MGTIAQLMAPGLASWRIRHPSGVVHTRRRNGMVDHARERGRAHAQLLPRPLAIVLDATIDIRA
jgi:hypothetical protein